MIYFLVLSSENLSLPLLAKLLTTCLDSVTMSNDFKILVLISGRGSNLKSILDKASNYSVCGILSNKPDAPGLQHGTPLGIPQYPFSRKDYASLADFKKAIFKKAQELNPDLVALAGFMQIIQPEFVEAFYGRMVNIHPALLPKFPGIHTHQRAIEAGESKHGCSIHFIDAGVDTGPIIAQASCDCFPETDNPDTLAARVLKLEHQLYPWVLSKIAAGAISLSNRQVCYREGVAAEAEELGFSLQPKTD